VSEQPSPATEAAPPRGRSRKTAGDMVRSLAVVLVLVGVIVAFNVAQQPDQVVRDVDYPAALAEARAQATYDVLGPDPLPAGWGISSARTEADGASVRWHVGMVTSSQEYAALEQSDGDPTALLGDVAAGARSAGNVDVAGHQWRRLVGGDPEERALIRSADDITVLVAGSASWGELRRLAASLRS
jgi:Protein of unknown function (DUF4245)